MSAEDETFEVTVSDTKSLAPNCWLWNESVGYLEVVKYSLYSDIVTVKNLGRRENAKKGTEFPTCMEFLITAPTALDPYNPLSTCLAADFNSPTVGQEAYMSVGSTYVIKVDDQIIVDSDYRYAVTQVVNATTLKVRNEGLGKEGIIEVGCDSCVPVQVVSKLNCCPIPSGDLISNTSVLTVNNGFDVLLDNASLTLDTDLSKYDNSSSEFITLNDVPRGTLNSNSSLLEVTGGANNVLGNITLSLDTDLSKYDNSSSEFITIGDIPRGELYSSTNILTVNNGDNNVLGNIELSVDTDLSKYNNTISRFLASSDKKNLTSNTSVLTVTNGTGATLENASLTLDTDLSKYDNTTSSFVSASDKKNLISTSPILTVTNGTGATLENTSLTLNIDLSQYDNSVSQFVTVGGLPSGYIISNTPVLSVSGGSGATLTNVSLTLDTDLSQYDNTTSGFITGISNLSDIGDVTLTSPQDGDVLTYDANSGEWINSTGGGGGSYLPLSGGTMTGSIRISGSGFTLGDSTQGWSTVYAGQVLNNSNTLRVGGNSSSIFYFAPTLTATTNCLGSSVSTWSSGYIDNIYTNDVYSNEEYLEIHGAANTNLRVVPIVSTGNYGFLGSATDRWRTIYSETLNIGQYTSISSNNSGKGITFTVRNSSDDGARYIFFYNDDVYPTNGNAVDLGRNGRWRTVYTNNIVDVSDIRVKDNLEDLKDALIKLNTISVKSYTLNGHDEGIIYGFIAQDELERNPELVVVPKDYSEESGGGQLGYMPNNVLFLAVKAIQELSSKVDELNAKIKVLEGKL